MDGKERERIHNLIKRIRSYLYVHQRAARIASLVMSLVLIFTSVSGLVYPSIKNEDYATGSRASGEVASGEAVDVNVSSGTDLSDDSGQDVTTGEKEGQASGQVAGIHGGESNDAASTNDAGDNIQDYQNEYDPSVDDTTANDPALMENGEQTIKKADQSGEKGFYMSREIDGVEVYVSADPGVFPQDATLDVKTLLPEERMRVEGVVEEAVGDERQISEKLTFDITIRDSFGNEIQPDVSKGEVRVAFVTGFVNTDNVTADIYHIRDISEHTDESDTNMNEVEGITEIQVSDPDLKVDRLTTKTGDIDDKDGVFARTDGFSYYTLTLTYQTNEYTLDAGVGDTVKVADIAAAVGLQGTFHSMCTTPGNQLPNISYSSSSYTEFFTVENSQNEQASITIKKPFSDKKLIAVHMSQEGKFDGNHCPIYITCTESEPEESYGVLLWSFGSKALGFKNSIKSYFEKIGVTVKTFEGNTLNQELINGVQLVYIIDEDYSDNDAAKMIYSDTNADILKSYVNNGGRVVMQGEHPNFSPAGNKNMSILASKIGASFTITDSLGKPGLKCEVNPESQLAKGAKNLKPICVAHIDTGAGSSAVWVARVYEEKDNKMVYYNFIVDQPAGKGRITAVSDVNWFDGYSGTSPEGEAATAIFENLLKDSATNMKKIMANPKPDMYYVTLNPSNESFYYRLKDTSENVLKNDKIKAYDASTDSELTVMDTYGWVKGNGKDIDITGLTPNTKYKLEYVQDDADVFNNGDPDAQYIQSTNVYTAIDPHDYVNKGEASQQEVHIARASDFSNGGDPTKDTVVISNIHDQNLRFALQYETGQLATEFVAPIDDGLGNGTYTVNFDGANRIFGDSPCYLIAKDPTKNNNLSGYVRIPACILMNEWMYDDEQQGSYSITDNDYVVKVENNNLTKDATADGYSVANDSTLTTSEAGTNHLKLSYNDALTDKYIADYSDTGTIDKAWIVRKQTYGDVIKDVYISTAGTQNGVTDIAKYVLPGGKLTSIEKTGELKDYITSHSYDDQYKVNYNIDPHNIDIEGNLTVTVHDTASNINDYNVTLNFITVDYVMYPTPEPTQSPTPVPVSPGGGTAPAPAPIVNTPAPTLSPTPAPTVTPSPEAPKNHKTEVVLLNGKYIQEARANGLSGFTDAQPEDDVTVRLEISEKTADDLEAKTAGRFRQIHKRVYENEKNKNVKKHYLEMLVTKQVDGEEPQQVTDLGDVIEIALTYDQLSDEEPLVIREHGGYASEMKELFRRPTGNYEDGTFYVSGDGIVYVYARYFSEYAVSYVEMADDGTVVKKDDGPGTTPAKSSVTWSGTSPETGDRMPLLFVWIMMLTSGLILLAYAMGFIGVRVREE
ncbi:MAG TPA: hypothetical protein DCP06_05500 [Lachnospiraceae bacterium]|nr:hypothetical protein [Lachnospiraceae bacterium]